MKATSVIFVILLTLISNYSNAQKAFTQVKTFLTNFKQTNVNEQATADIREKKERAWCKKEIAEALHVLAERQKDVDSIEEHIVYLQKTKIELEKDRETRKKRIADNLILLNKFKKQRCDNNLLFVKNLRDHIEAINVLTLLRQDIVDYFHGKLKFAPKKKAAFDFKLVKSSRKPSTRKTTSRGASRTKVVKTSQQIQNRVIREETKIAAAKARAASNTFTIVKSSRRRSANSGTQQKTSAQTQSRKVVSTARLHQQKRSQRMEINKVIQKQAAAKARAASNTFTNVRSSRRNSATRITQHQSGEKSQSRQTAARITVTSNTYDNVKSSKRRSRTKTTEAVRTTRAASNTYNNIRSTKTRSRSQTGEAVITARAASNTYDNVKSSRRKSRTKTTEAVRRNTRAASNTYNNIRSTRTRSKTVITAKAASNTYDNVRSSRRRSRTKTTEAVRTTRATSNTYNNARSTRSRSQTVITAKAASKTYNNVRSAKARSQNQIAEAERIAKKASSRTYVSRSRASITTSAVSSSSNNAKTIVNANASTSNQFTLVRSSRRATRKITKKARTTTTITSKKNEYTKEEQEECDADEEKEEKSASDSKKGEIELLQILTTEEQIEKENFHRATLNLIERISKLNELSHLFDEENKLILVELTRFSGDVSKETNQVNSITSTHQRTNKEIGSGHVDNKRGALKRLATPDYEGTASFNINAEKKILGMIDGLIHHLKESREKLTQDEIQAALDFAVFQSNTLKENEYLEITIVRITKKITIIINDIAISKSQLIRRKILRDKARAKLLALRKLCQQKYAYFAQETRRRIDENKIIDRAITVFNALFLRLTHSRAARRSSANFSGVKYDKPDNVQERVVHAEPGVSTSLSSRVKSRNAVVFPELNMEEGTFYFE